MSEAANRWQAKRRAELDALKLSQGGCVDCGYNEHPAALHWDHVGDDKQQATGTRKAFERTWAWERILAEIAKCELVCANCHAIRTANRGYKGGTPTHGAERQPLTPGEFGRKTTRQTHCWRGHEMTDDNVYTSPKGKRSCRKCVRERQRKPSASPE